MKILIILTRIAAVLFFLFAVILYLIIGLPSILAGTRNIPLGLAPGRPAGRRSLSRSANPVKGETNGI